MNSVRFRGSIDENDKERRNADDREVGAAERRHGMPAAVIRRRVA
jgi:hypothetical protein